MSLVERGNDKSQMSKEEFLFNLGLLPNDLKNKIETFKKARQVRSSKIKLQNLINSTIQKTIQRSKAEENPKDNSSSENSLVEDKPERFIKTFNMNDLKVVRVRVVNKESKKKYKFGFRKEYSCY